MRQPDIEIYLRDDHVTDLLDWLHQAMGPLTLDEPKGLTQHGALHGDQTIPLMVVRKGRTFHRVAGWAWVALVATTAGAWSRTPARN